MKINKSFLEQLIIEQIQLMENNQKSQKFLNVISEIGSLWLQTLEKNAPQQKGIREREDMERLFIKSAKEKLNPFIGNHIFIKVGDTRANRQDYYHTF